jgi:hypothetical protein
MPNADIINVSDSLLRFANKTRLFSDSSTISDVVSKVTAKAAIKTLSDDITVSEAIALEQAKARIISETTTIAETIELYKNGILVEPVAEIPTPQNILGTRERRVRAPKRAPRAIVIDEVSNIVTASLKLLAFTDSINKAMVGIRPGLVTNVARLSLRTLRHTHSDDNRIAYCGIKTSPQPMIVKAALCLPLSSLYLTTAKLKLRPEIKHNIQSLKAINPQRIDKLHKLVVLSMMIEKL